jgi:hypothetical protein
MASPCPHCGSTKTESVRHGLLYRLSWRMGYHLRRCSYCRRERLFKRAKDQRHPNEMTTEELKEIFDRKIAESRAKESAAPETQGGKMESNSSEETSRSREQASEPSAGEGERSQEVEDYRLCPKCGSILYRRSRRRWWERMIGRPRMARCLRCDHRFPYPH